MAVRTASDPIGATRSRDNGAMKRSLPACRTLATALTLSALLMLFACSLPLRGDPPVSTVLPASETADTWIARTTLAARQAHPGLSAILPLTTGLEAFAGRVALMRSAERSLDLQYYIWHDDLTGRMIMAEAVAAADRGVRVRMLLDDNGIAGLDPILAALDSHPSIEVRIFNPFPTRRAKWIGFVTDFSRVNRRMHNKSLTADGLVSIVGGRNIGNEYFDARGTVTFADLDVVAVGPAAEAIGADFDRYWNSPVVWPAAALLPAAPADALARLREDAVAQADEPEAQTYRESIRSMVTIAEIGSRIARREWVRTSLVSDDPAKATGKAGRDSLLLARLGEVVDRPKARFDLISPYFVPMAEGTAALAGLARGGVAVRVLTNSLQANDVAVVHAGYAKRRRALLEAGVHLYELRPFETSGRRGHSSDSGSGPGSGSGSGPAGVAGSSSASLHAKTFALDGHQVFVGSFNFDPRSAELNTELGVIIDSSALADEMRRVFDEELERAAWTLSLGEDGGLRWTGRDEHGGLDVRLAEPDAPLWQRVFLRVVSWLPIDRLL